MDNNFPNVPATEGELNELIDSSQTKKTSTAGYIFLSLIFPPFTTVLALFFAARKNILHLILPSTSVVYSAITLLIGVGNLFNLNTQSPYAQYETIAQPIQFSLMTKFLTFLCLIIGASGIFAGIFFRLKAKREYNLHNNILFSLGGLIILEFVVVSWLLQILISAYFSSVAPVIKGSYQGL